LDGQVCRIFSFEDAIYIIGCAAEQIVEFNAISDKPAFLGMASKGINRWNAIPSCEHNNRLYLGRNWRRWQNDQATTRLLSKARYALSISAES